MLQLQKFVLICDWSLVFDWLWAQSLVLFLFLPSLLPIYKPALKSIKEVLVIKASSLIENGEVLLHLKNLLLDLGLMPTKFS